MNPILRLFIPADWPTRQTACEWELVNPAGARLQLGSSEPRHWPPAERCELILSAEQCLLVNIALPKGARARTPEAVAYALEDQLLGETDAEYFVGDSLESSNVKDKAASHTPVWIIARARLQALLAVLRPLGRIPHRLISEIQLAPLKGGWTVCLKQTGGFARLAAEDGFTFDLQQPESDFSAPPHELHLALQAARQADRLPSAIDVYAAQGVTFDAPAAAAWQSALGVPVHLAGEYAWRDCRSREARNLLGSAGEFAPPRQPQEGWGSLRPALQLAVLALTIYSVFSLGEWAWLNHQKSQLRQQMADRFRATFPQVQAVVDAPLQMQRLHDQLRRERGQLGSSDFLPLLAAASEATHGQGQLRSVSFEDGRLEMTLLMANAAAVERLRETMTRRGLNVILRDSRPSGSSIEAVFAVRGTS